MANARLVNKGRAHTISTIAQLGRISIANASAHTEALVPHGWTSEQTVQLGVDVARLMETEAAKVDARTTSKNLTTEEKQARLEAKA
ncbi:hypothetical protein KJ865_11500, partial [Myxococcota bacterium]|nr:hypothetical protein [Myxococcota bacterium]